LAGVLYQTRPHPVKHHFLYDGTKLQGIDTPDDLNMEDGDKIEVIEGLTGD
jgi:hypothetical protein